ncbi:MAG: hypothetical protein Q4A05_11520 [Ruminococcus sp.]|nr:hypothetical protein [Ruminococcus sp.]
MVRKIDSPVLLLLVGAFLLYGGIDNIKKYDELKKKCTAQTTGRVFYVERTGSRKTGKYDGYITFTVEEQDYSVTLGTKRYRSHNKDTVAVAYDPADPSMNYSPTIPPNRGIVDSLLGSFSMLSFFSWLLYKIKIKPRDE